ncbi:hypothetical protein RRG08_025067 [Elysia crispata]|uniref:Uncharacterized protein n=1 Tax=Elysia crispata TaxID=231223 RepID=A0AAE1E0H3_9GAST|nr:hypothetical protein RRG08_025067 [Elysia crispata]
MFYKGASFSNVIGRVCSVPHPRSLVCRCLRHEPPLSSPDCQTPPARPALRQNQSLLDNTLPRYISCPGVVPMESRESSQEFPDQATLRDLCQCTTRSIDLMQNFL